MSENQIKKSALSIPVMFEKIEEFTCDDGRFTKVKCWLMHTELNLNGSYFEKEVINNAIPTLQYIPIVGFLQKDSLGEDDFSDHRYIISKNENGVYRKYLGSAYGVILSNADNNAHFEMKICDDGVEREFIVADGIIWNMFDDSSNVFNRDLIKDHSIELDENSVDGYEDENGIFHFTKFSFRAACALGSGCQPAMTGSTIEVQFTMTDFVKNIQSELNDKFTAFTKLVNEKSNQGGIGIMPNTDFTQTVMEQFSDISNMVKDYEVMVNKWGDEVPRFYLQDIQENEVIVVDRNNNYCYYGFPFVINGDKAEIDFTNGNRKKVRYENYEDGTTVPESAFDFGKHIADIEEIAFTKVNEANEKVVVAEGEKATAEANYTQIKADYDEMKPKYENYVRADNERQVAELNAQKDAKFAEYEDTLGENAEFVALKERKGELSVDDIEKECAVLYVRTNRPKPNFSKSTSTPAVVGVMDDGDATDGFVNTKYGYIPVGR